MNLWIYSKHISKIFDLFLKSKKLSEGQAEKERWAQAYFSIGFEKQYKEKFGDDAYKNFIKTIEHKYPEFKQ